MFLASLLPCMHFRRSKEKESIYRNDHLLVLSCHSSVRMAHSKVLKQLVTELFFHPLCIRSSLHSAPLSSPPAISGAPGPRHPQHPRRRPQRGAAPRRRRGRCQPPSAAVSNLRCRRARRRQRLEGSTPWLPTAHPHLQQEKLQSVE